MGRSCVPSEGDVISGNAALATAAFLGMGLLCGFEMLLLIWRRFRRRSGLYFWSLVMATFAEITVNVSNILYFWVLKDACPAITATLAVPAAFLFVLFEYLILYSRLRLVQTSEKKMRILLYIVILEAALVELPLAIISIGTYARPSSIFTPLYYRMWQAEAVVYTIVDAILSAMYIFQVRSMWKKQDSGMKVHAILRDIIYMTVFVVGLDAANAVMVYIPQTFSIMYGFEGFVFAFKLKVEMWSLNKLTKLSKAALEKEEEYSGVSTLAEWKG